MNTHDSVIAVFPDHAGAEAAVKKLTAGGVAMKSLSIVGKGYHTEEAVVGFYNTGDRVRFWGSRGAFWGAFWGLFFGGVVLTTPVVGPVIVLGFLTTSLISALEGAVVIGGIGALGAAFASIGVPKDSIVQYETAIAADSFLVMAHGATDQVMHAKALLDGALPKQVDVHGAAADALPSSRFVMVG
jgi:hypothetical protein